MTLYKERVAAPLQLPDLCQSFGSLVAIEGKHPPLPSKCENTLKSLFPRTFHQPLISFEEKGEMEHRPLTVGVVLSGGQAPGGHNVITGLFDALKKLNPKSRLIGFLDGPKGIIVNRSIPLEAEVIDRYRNTGGFDMIGAGRDKIETAQDFVAAVETVKTHKLDGIVIIGGDDSNTNAALLAEHFVNNNIGCSVIGVPKTIDGDLRNEYVESSFGFDTATKTYSAAIGNLARDSLSAKKYYFFIKLMGRSASHIALECAQNTQPNLTLIGEEIARDSRTFESLICEIADMICRRSEKGKNYGVILIPEGIIEFVPEFKKLVSELNALLSPDKAHGEALEQLAKDKEKVEYILHYLSEESRSCFSSLPGLIQLQLLRDRDAHGNVPVSKIETERLFIAAVQEELALRKQNRKYHGKFSAQPLFYGYEGRSTYPTLFDAHYCYALGHVSALLIDQKKTAMMACVRYLDKSPSDWAMMGVPLVPLMQIEERHGKAKPVIRKALVDLNSEPFLSFAKGRESWKVEDKYLYPGPIQF